MGNLIECPKHNGGVRFHIWGSQSQTGLREFKDISCKGGSKHNLYID